MVDSSRDSAAVWTRLAAAPYWAVLLAAFDSAYVREQWSYRPLGASLFLQCVVLWGAYALLATLPAAWSERLLASAGLWPRQQIFGSQRSGAERRWPGLARWLLVLYWTGLPVLLHARLDRYTGLGQNLDGLARPWPWLEVLAWAVALAVLLFLLQRVLARRPLGWIASLLLLFALGLGLWPAEPPKASLGPALVPAQRPPNLLLLVIDTLRADHLTAYGYARANSPRISALAEQSLLFETVHSASRFTFTSHLSLLTGVYPSEHGARMLDMRYRPERAESIAELLRVAGYRTAAFVGTNVLSGETGIAHGFEVYRDQVDPPLCDSIGWSLLHDAQAAAAEVFPCCNANGLPHWFQDFQRPAPEVLAEAQAWIGNVDSRPWFALVNLYDVHWPYLPSEGARAEWVAPYSGPLDGYVFRSNDFPAGYQPGERDNQHLAQLYDAELFDLDAKVGAFLDSLKLEQGGTALVLTSDHGEAFGEGGRYEHDDILEPQVRVPLLLRLPQAAPLALRVQGPASGVDLAPTLLALAGLAPGPKMRGLDLVAAAQQGPLPARPVLVEDRDHPEPWDLRLAFYREQWKHVQLGQGPLARRQLFDLAADPVGLEDLAPVAAGRLEELRLGLEAFRALWGGAQERLLEVDGHAVEGLDALGYTGEE